MKQCTSCQIEKHLFDFSVNVNNRDGRHTQCKECRNKRQRRAVILLPPEERLEGQETPPRAITVSGCGCPLRALCGHCGGVSSGKAVSCRFCRLPVKAKKAHQVDCSEMGFFNRIDPTAPRKSSLLIEAGLVFGY